MLIFQHQREIALNIYAYSQSNVKFSQQFRIILLSKMLFKFLNLMIISKKFKARN
jgi:hypothetical protein